MARIPEVSSNGLKRKWEKIISHRNSKNRKTFFDFFPDNDMKLYKDKLTGMKNLHAKFQVSRSSESLFLYCKILQNCNFLYLSVLDCHKNHYNEMKLYRNKLAGMKNLHAKFQVSGSSGSMFLYCKILQDSDFLYLFLSVAPTEIEALT